MPFEVSTADKRSGAYPHAGIEVSLTSYGMIKFSRDAYAAMGCPPYLQYLYAREDNAITFQPIAESNPHAYKVQLSKHQIAHVTGRAFLDAYTLRPERTRWYPATWEHGVLIVPLGPKEQASCQ